MSAWKNTKETENRDLLESAAKQGLGQLAMAAFSRYHFRSGAINSKPSANIFRAEGSGTRRSMGSIGLWLQGLFCGILGLQPEVQG